MKRKLKNKKFILLLSTCILLPSCAPSNFFNWFRGQNNTIDNMAPEKVIKITVNEDTLSDVSNLTGDVLVSFNGRPVITVDSLEAQKQKLIESNPQIKMALKFMDPVQFDRELTNGIMDQKIIEKHVQDNNINQSTQFKNELKEGYKAINDMLNIKYFGQSFTVNVSDADVQDFYNKNKDMIPNVLLSQGFTQALGVEFTSDKDAQDFAQKVRANNNDIKSTAQKAGLADDAVKDFKSVNSASIAIEPVVRDAIIAITKVPTVEVIKANDTTFWVILATQHQDAQYKPFEQVKATLKPAVEKNKRDEMFSQEIERLKKEYNVVLNENYFKSNQTPQEAQEALKKAEMVLMQDDQFMQ